MEESSSNSKLNLYLSKLKDFWNNSNFAKFLPVAVIGLALPVIVFVAMQTQNIRQHAQLSGEQASLRDLTNYVISGGSNDPLKITASALGSDSIAQEARNLVVVDKSRVRKELMKKLAIENPQEFLLNALPSRVTDSFPSIIKDNMEKQVKFSGKLVILHLDDFKGKKDKYVYQIQQLDKDNKVVKTYTLHFAKAIPSALTDSKVKIEGYVLDNELVVQGGGGGGDGGGDSSFSVFENSKSNPLGNQKILVIMFNFTDDATEPVSKDKLNEIFLTGANSVDKYIKETSNEKASISVDYAGYYKIPYSNFYCDNFDQWATSAEAIAFSNGIDINAYPRHIFIFPTRGNCWASAWATIGGVPSKAWMNSNAEPGIYDHELGHNLGLSHANSLDCGVKSINDFNEYGQPDGCNSIEYGDPTDVMGYGVYSVSFQYDGSHKDELNWLDPSDIQSINSDATTTISSLEGISTTPKIVKIPVPVSDEFYYVSYRKAIGMDTNIGDGITKGVSIHLWKKQNQLYDYSEQTKLIDNTPEGSTGNDFSNSSLSDGQTFSDPYNGIAIKQTSHNLDSATLEIKIDKSVCRRQVPDVDISPISQVGTAGQELSYVINLKNNDTSQCDASTFNFSAQGSGPYQGQWGETFSPDTVTLSPGQSTSLTETIHSAGNSPIGVYTIATSIASNNIRHSVTLKSSYIVFGQLSLINVNPGTIETSLGSLPIGMSALAYDNNNQPIRTGVKYEWSMSSVNSVGTLDPKNDVINRFTPLKPGFGEITVKGTLNGESIIKTVPVHVSGVITPTPTDSPTPTTTPSDTPTPTVTPTNTPTPTPVPTNTPTPTLTPTFTPVPTQVPPTNIVKITPSADAYVRSDTPNKNYGSEIRLLAKGAPKMVTFLKFDLRSLANKNIIKATLTIKVSNVDNAQSASTQSVEYLGNSNWQETRINYNNRPIPFGQAASVKANKRNTTFAIDLTAWVNSYKATVGSFAIENFSSDGLIFNSKESNVGKPTLTITYN